MRDSPRDAGTFDVWDNAMVPQSARCNKVITGS